MNDDKPLITRNQAIFLAHQSKKRKQETKAKKNFLIREIIIVVLTFTIFYIIANYPAFSAITNYWFNKPQPVVKTVTPEPTPIPTPTPEPTPEPVVTPSTITIPKIGIEAPIIWDINFDAIRENLNEGVVQYVESAYPGQIGNMFIVGHSSDYVWSKGKYKSIFALLPKLTNGDQIIISYKGKEYIYETFNYKIVAPTDISVIEPTDNAIVTLMTCWPIGTSQKRYIVQAKLISPKPSGEQTTYPSILGLPKTR
ncbi:MAG: class E sortase [bacterium]|nr:class E sortase [bacterium]